MSNAPTITDDLDTMTPEQARRVKSAIAACDRVLTRARSYTLHPDTALIAEYEANKARLEAMLAN